MSLIYAEIDLSALSITGTQTVTLATTDTFGVSLTIATLTQDYTGVSTSEFINLIRAEVNGGSSGFLAYNESPTLKLTREVDIDTFIGEQVSLTFSTSNFNASWIKDVSTATPCPACYPYDLFDCYANYVIDVGLSASTTYNITITDKFEHNYHQAVTTDTDGKFTLVEADYPTALFHPTNGQLTLSIATTENVAVSFVIGYLEYECLLLSTEYLTSV